MFKKLFSKKAIDPDPIWSQLEQGISPSAAAIAAVHAGIELIGTTLATARFQVHKQLPDGKTERIYNHAVHDILNMPDKRLRNSYNEYIRDSIRDLIIFGNAVSVYHRGNLIRIPWTFVSIEQMANGKLRYRVTFPQLNPANANEGSTLFTAANVMHLKMASDNGGITGVSPLRRCEQTIVLADELERAQIALWRNSTMPSGTLKAKKTLQPSRKAKLQENIKNFSGSSNRGKLLLLEDDIEYKPVMATAENNQLVEQRESTITAIANVLGVSKVLLNSIGESNYSTTKELVRTHSVFCLSFYAQMFSQKLTQLLLEGTNEFITISLDHFQRASMKERFDAWNIAIERNIVDAERVRELEEL